MAQLFEVVGKDGAQVYQLQFGKLIEIKDLVLSKGDVINVEETCLANRNYVRYDRPFAADTADGYYVEVGLLRPVA